MVGHAKKKVKRVQRVEGCVARAMFAVVASLLVGGKQFVVAAAVAHMA